MIVRVINALTWVSLLLAIFVFIISYAGFPDDVLVYINAAGQEVLYLERNLAFYCLLAIIVIFNGGFQSIAGLVNKTTPHLQTTIIGIGLVQIAFNFFIATSIYFVNLLNSRENFDYSNFGYLIYVTGGLLIAALLYTVFARLTLKK